MSHAAPACFADRAWHGEVLVLENVRLARDTYRLRFDCPQLASQITPGQFLMLRLQGASDPLLGRPLALYDTVLNARGEATGVDVVYLVVGKLTRQLAEFGPGRRLEVWGPLGNGFPPQPVEHLVMVAGGIGQTPFLALAQEYLGLKQYGQADRRQARASQVTLCYGARTRDYLAGVADFERLGVRVRIATDDGSAGRRGLVTQVLKEALEESPGPCRVACCGPEKMMHAVAELTRQRKIPCQLSLESPMACGIGICFSCVAKVRDAEGQWDYRRTCVEGPVFEANQLVLD